MLFDIKPKENRGDFYDRERELSELLKAVRLGEQLIIVYGIRRIGKSSLVKVAMRELPLPYVLIDVRKIYFRANMVTEQYLVEEIVDVFRKHMKWYEKIGFNIREVLGKVKKVRVKDYEIEIAPPAKLSIIKLLEAVDSWCGRHGSKFIFVFDEAQYLRFSNIRYDGILAWAIDNLDNISFILTGSEVGVLRDFLRIEDAKAPLYGRYRREMYLKRFSEEESTGFLRTGFKELGVRVTDREVAEAVEILDGIVGWLTYYGYYRGIVGLSHKEAVNKVLHEGSKLVLSELEKIIAPSRRRYLAILKAIAQGAESWSDIKAYVTVRTGHISDKRFTELLKKLAKYGYIAKENNKYRILDPIVRETCKALEI